MKTFKGKSEFQARQNLKSNALAADKVCDRGDALLSGSGVCFESGADRDVTPGDGGDYLCGSGSCFECGL